MIFGTTKFRCDKCGNVFQGLAAEWMATCIVAPVECPQCGSFHTYPPSFFRRTAPKTYREIWKMMDESKGD